MYWILGYSEEEGLMSLGMERCYRSTYTFSRQPTKKGRSLLLFRGSGGGLGMQRVHGGSSLAEWYLGLQGQGLGDFTTLGGRILDPVREVSGLGLVGLQEVVFDGRLRGGGRGGPWDWQGGGP